MCQRVLSSVRWRARCRYSFRPPLGRVRCHPFLFAVAVAVAGVGVAFAARNVHGGETERQREIELFAQPLPLGSVTSASEQIELKRFGLPLENRSEPPAVDSLHCLCGSSTYASGSAVLSCRFFRVASLSSLSSMVSAACLIVGGVTLGANCWFWPGKKKQRALLVSFACPWRGRPLSPKVSWALGKGDFSGAVAVALEQRHLLRQHDFQVKGSVCDRVGCGID